MPNQSNQTQPTSCPAPKEGSFRTTIGGQALIEGILMRGPEKQAIVVRDQGGNLVEKVEELRLIKDRHPILGWPLIRGTVNFLSSMVNGVKALMYSGPIASLRMRPTGMRNVPEIFAGESSAIDSSLRLGTT